MKPLQSEWFSFKTILCNYSTKGFVLISAGLLMLGLLVTCQTNNTTSGKSLSSENSVSQNSKSMEKKKNATEGESQTDVLRDQPKKTPTEKEVKKVEPLPHLAAYLKKANQATDKLFDKPVVTLHTDYGDIVIQFFKNAAPKHVESFLKLAKQKFYDGTIFHRVIPRFMIQGGDPNTKGQADNKGTHIQNYGFGGPGFTVPMEYQPIAYEPGILAAARSPDPDSAGSQFFIMTGFRPDFGAVTPEGDLRYTIFGAVVKGMDVVETIESLPRRSTPPALNCPYDRVEMTVTVEE